MFQSFDATTSPEQGPPRLQALRTELLAEGLDGFLVPRADAHQGEYVADRDQRLAWLTGFTGSAGFAVVLAETAAIFVDGRYTLQVRDQVAEAFTPVAWPSTKLGPWLVDHAPADARIGFDPWLHTRAELAELERSAPGVALVPTENLVDRIWHNQPAPPAGKAKAHAIEYAGETSGAKRTRIAEVLRAEGQRAAVLTLPDSLCWLLNIRGSDIERSPLVLAFAILHDTGRVSLFADPAKFADLGPDPHIDIAPASDFAGALATLDGPVRVDRATAPAAVSAALRKAGVELHWAPDPCVLPKAKKNAAEIAGARAAHLRDGAAMVEFLAWLDQEAPKDRLTEIDVATALEGFRTATGALRDISFDTIAGSGPNGAIVHYRVTNETNRALGEGELMLVDSGGQYVDGTTDITRTIAIGTPGVDEVAAFTRVLRGMIALSRLRWPRGLAGRDIEAVARAPLWTAGQDYDHGTGHGVGSFLGVHEGPHRLSRTGTVPLEPGMILSNEPGYYRTGAFGIRIENLVLVQDAPPLDGADARDMLAFETLTLAPIDRRLIDTQQLTRDELAWLDAYHARVRAALSDEVSPEAAEWLDDATQPLTYEQT